MSAPFEERGSPPASLATAISAAVRGRRCTSREVAEWYLGRIESLDPALGAFLHVDAPEVLRQADDVDQRVAAGEDHGELLGVPVALKDNICARGQPTTCASRVLADFRPAFDATVTERLRASGAIVLGKTNLDEFAMGASTESSAFQLTRNPHDRNRVPGGSSGGSAAAVAAGLAPLALGSDTGGSVRQPAAFCGTVGHRPTYGTVSRSGLVAFASSLDQIGPLALAAGDARRLLRVIAGPDPGDSTSVTAPPPEAPGRSPAGLRVGLPRQYASDSLPEAIHAGLQRCQDLLREAGATFSEVDLPLTPHAIPTYYLLVMSEASSNLARFDGVRYGPRATGELLEDMYARTRAQFGDEVKRRILLGTFALSAGYYDAYYKKALQVRQRMGEEFERAFQEVDVMLCPTTPTTAFTIGEKGRDPLDLYLCDVFTAPAALAGLPAVSFPVAKDADGLPVGAQLIGPRFSDGRLLDLVELLQSGLPYPLQPVEVNGGP